MAHIENNGPFRKYFGPAIPTTGKWNVGDQWVNDDPAAGEAPSAVCVAAGEPGTWKVFGPLSQGAVADIQSAVVTLTAANIKALRATPITLVAAPGSGKYIQPIAAALFLDAGTEALTESADNLGIKYENGSGAQVSEDIETTGFLTATSDVMVQTIFKKDIVIPANKALVLHNLGDGEIAGNATGDAVLKVFITYKTIAVA